MQLHDYRTSSIATGYYHAATVRSVLFVASYRPLSSCCGEAILMVEEESRSLSCARIWFSVQSVPRGTRTQSRREMHEQRHE